MTGRVDLDTILSKGLPAKIGRIPFTPDKIEIVGIPHFRVGFYQEPIMMTELNNHSAPEMPGWIILLIPLAFFTVFPIIWCFVMWINSRLSGWHRLAKQYVTDQTPDGRLWSGVHGQVGIVSYKNTLDCTTTPEGLFLRPGPLFRFAHPLLFIPWSHLTNVRKTTMLWLSMIQADIGDPRLARLRISARVFEQSEGSSLLDEASG